MSQTEAIDVRKKILATGIRNGTQVRTKFMRPFITQASPEGHYIIDLEITLQRVEAAAKFISRIPIENVIACSGHKYALTPIEKFCELTGAIPKVNRFMPGTLTNPSLPYYTEPKLVLVSDPQVDGQAVTEATNAGIPVIGISNTDNITSNIDLVIPANNRGRKALATAYWLLARAILIERGEIKDDEPIKYDIDDFETKGMDGSTD